MKTLLHNSCYRVPCSTADPLGSHRIRAGCTRHHAGPVLGSELERKSKRRNVSLTPAGHTGTGLPWRGDGLALPPPTRLCAGRVASSLHFPGHLPSRTGDWDMARLLGGPSVLTRWCLVDAQQSADSVDPLPTVGRLSSTPWGLAVPLAVKASRTRCLTAALHLLPWTRRPAPSFPDPCDPAAREEWSPCFLCSAMRTQVGGRPCLAESTESLTCHKTTLNETLPTSRLHLKTKHQPE